MKYSLKTFLLVSACLSLAIGLWIKSTEVESLKAELVKSKSEAAKYKGQVKDSMTFIDVEDDNKTLHVSWICADGTPDGFVWNIVDDVSPGHTQMRRDSERKSAARASLHGTVENH